ncbi:hypothetical protein SCLCIDRAFT_1214724 [Scleroderma citrinum Foug A]|uniref:Uncharacterized protein n=1 Tax=Scleroderma citrinum Foug A TaxID=1036808 RepID=A0A0C2ZMV2_9AGAM|nr:hypothetical protein SCLCIDRAFT_1214724 [Scleroderma citrinum Foug A]
MGLCHTALDPQNAFALTCPMRWSCRDDASPYRDLIAVRGLHRQSPIHGHFPVTKFVTDTILSLPGSRGRAALCICI